MSEVRSRRRERAKVLYELTTHQHTHTSGALRGPPGGGGNFQSLLRRSERTGASIIHLFNHMTGQGEKVLFREEGVELSLDDVYDAREIVSKHAKVTPVFTNSTIR